MDRKLMNTLLSKTEQITIEYKLSSNGINDETACSFSNIYGGYIILCENPCTTVEDIMKHYDLSRSTIFRDYEAIKKALGADCHSNRSLWPR